MEKVNEEKAHLEIALTQAQQELLLLKSTSSPGNKAIAELRTSCDQQSRDLDSLIDFASRIFRDEYPSPHEEETIASLILMYRPDDNPYIYDLI